MVAQDRGLKKRPLPCLPTRYENIRITVFHDQAEDKEHIAVIKGYIEGRDAVPLQLHLECLIGDTLGSLRCDTAGSSCPKSWNIWGRRISGSRYV